MFNCRASIGSQITWFKRMKGSSSLSSVQKLGKRFNVFPNGSLKIHPVQKIDEAFYRCRAENPVGYNNASAFLRVLGMYAGYAFPSPQFPARPKPVHRLLDLVLRSLLASFLSLKAS